MSDYIIIILSSTVLASLLSSIISYITNKKNVSLQYITGERKEWRNEIRKLTEKIYNANESNMGGILVKLKTRLNAYGRYEDNVEKDRHIWVVINQLENEEYNKIFDYNKDLLIDYLTLLLKYDWERLKEEVIGNKRMIYKIIFYIGSICTFSYIYLYSWDLPIKYGFIDILTELTFFCFITPPYIITEAFGTDKLKKMSFKKVINKIERYYLFVMGLCIAFTIYDIIKIYNTVKTKGYNTLLQIISIIMIILYFFLFSFLNARRVQRNKLDYIFTIMCEEREKNNLLNNIELKVDKPLTND